MRFRSTVELGGKTATGIPVPDDVVDRLGSGKRPTVRVTVGGHSYRTTVAPMGGRFLVPLSKEHRTAAGVGAGDDVEVDIELDTESRAVEMPADLVRALRGQADARACFDGLAPSHQKEYVRWIEEAKKPETRERRVAKAAADLQAGRSRHS